MKPFTLKPDCEFEADALAAALQSRWPEQVDAELRAHIAHCPVCSDVVITASAVDDARIEMRGRTVVPDSGVVWWRAQLRARREAAEAAGHPITAAQCLAFASAVGLLGACFGATSSWFQSAFRSIVSHLGGLGAKTFFGSAIMMLAQHGALALGAAAMLFLVPTVVILTLRRD
jgi:predicted anti-sigma-YlaC factor YlaD